MLVLSLQGDTVEALCARHLGTTGGGVVEATLNATTGLAELGVILPSGTEVDLVASASTAAAATAQTINLWD